MAVRWSYAEPTPSFADRCLPVVAVYRRWCHKQPVCGLFLLVLLLVFQPALEIYKIQRAEVELSLKNNEKDALRPLLCSSCWVFVFVYSACNVFLKLSVYVANSSTNPDSNYAQHHPQWVTRCTGWVGWMPTQQIPTQNKTQYHKCPLLKSGLLYTGCMHAWLWL